MRLLNNLFHFCKNRLKIILKHLPSRHMKHDDYFMVIQGNRWYKVYNIVYKLVYHNMKHEGVTLVLTYI